MVLDVAGVHKRYHVNAARAFSLGEPSPEVRECAARAAGVMDRVRECLRPSLPVRELNEVTRRYYEETGLWDSRGWVGGYEMGIALFPDWVGNFVYDPLAETNADRAFEPGTAVNYEVQVFLPQHAGCFVAIETLLFGERMSRSPPSRSPTGLPLSSEAPLACPGSFEDWNVCESWRRCRRRRHPREHRYPAPMSLRRSPVRRSG